MNLFELKDKVMLVTGGCGVLGGGITKYLLENEATVILLHYKQEALTDTIYKLKNQAQHCINANINKHKPLWSKQL